MFSQASVILLMGGCLPQCMLGYTPFPRTDTPQEQTPLPGSRHPLPSRHHSPQSMLGDTVNARAVRILLECNLVLFLEFRIFSLFVTYPLKVYILDVDHEYRPSISSKVISTKCQPGTRENVSLMTLKKSNGAHREETSST